MSRWLLAISLFDGINRDNLGFNDIFRLVANIINVAMYLVGALSVIFIIVGGLRYTLSGGDPKNTAQAKNTILYAVIGIIISVSAIIIRDFVIKGLS